MELSVDVVTPFFLRFQRLFKSVSDCQSASVEISHDIGVQRILSLWPSSSSSTGIDYQLIIGRVVVGGDKNSFHFLKIEIMKKGIIRAG